jgi:anti-sigma factor RsiW
MEPAQTCSSVGRLLGAHLDGQLDPVKTLDVEEHLGACEVCRERLALDRALRGSLKRAMRATSAPPDVKERLLAAMAAESSREQKRDASEAAEAASSRSMLRHWRTMLPVASAAALALAWGAAAKQPVSHGTPDVMRVAGFANDDLLRELVAVHSRPLSPERTDPSDVRALERDVGVPVRVPQINRNARFVGGRVLPVRQGSERAAMLQYEIKQGDGVQRVSVFIYDPRRIQVNGPNLAPRAVGTAEVRVGQSNGYSIAVLQHHDVGYALASDLDPESSARLVAAADGE